MRTVELDVGVTADDVVVVAHDPHLNPDITRDARGDWIDRDPPPIRTLTFAQLQTFDVGRIRPGSDYAAAFPDQQPEDGARIPSLTEVLALDPRATFFVELKTFPTHPGLTAPPGRMADLVVEAAERAGATGRMTVLSFDWRGLRHLQRHRPDVPLGWLTERAGQSWRSLWWDMPRRVGEILPVAPAAVRQAGGRLWLPALDAIEPEMLGLARTFGLEVIVWGVSDREGAKRAAALGVDGVITDRPDLA